MVDTHPHIWLFVDGECVEHLGQHQNPSVHMSLASARRLHEQLGEMIARLTEAI